METKHNNDGIKPEGSRIKSQQLLSEKRLRQCALWSATRGNREMASSEEVFQHANEFRMILDRREMTLDELENWIFSCWQTPIPLGDDLEFGSTNPPSGG